MKIKLDWRAYFDGFCELHGKPVDCRGRLLFQDGWTYSRTDHSGPEWPPPTDPKELAEFQRDYWSIRLAKAELEYTDARRIYENLEGMASKRSAPLKCGTRYFDEETNRYRRGVTDVSLSSFQDEVLMLKEEVEECKKHLTMDVDSLFWSNR